MRKNRGINKSVLIILILLGVFIASSYTVFAQEDTESLTITFSDVPTEYWATDAIYWAVERGAITGYIDGTFKPKAQLTEEEFASMLARYTKIELGEQIKGKWSQHFYDGLAKYALPFKGYTNEVAKKTAPTRGDIARIIAAKNGFNLTERQAIYYMYENDLSNGMINGQMTFESYGADKPFERDQAVTFLKSIHEKGYTTFMGKPSNISSEQMGGIVGVPEDKTEITDDMFDKLAKDRGKTNPPRESKVYGTIDNPVIVKLGAGETFTNSDEFKKAIDANPELKHKLVANVNGIVTPASIGFTKCDVSNGLVIQTTLDQNFARVGFKDKELFIKVIKENWTDILNDEQIKAIEDMTNKHHNKAGLKIERKEISNDKHKLILVGQGGQIAIQVYKK